MKINMTSVDRILRIVIAIIFAVLYVTGVVGSTAGIVLLIIGIVFTLTSITGFCPIYRILGIGKNITTRKQESSIRS